MTGGEGELYSLFRRACTLEGVPRERLLAEVASTDARLAAELRSLLAADERGGAVPRESTGLHALGGASPGATAGAGLDIERLRAEVAELAARSRGGERYRLGEELGRGAMGRVRRVVDLPLGRELAMKTIRGDTGGMAGEEPVRLARFLNEARILGRLSHPGIVSIHELGIDGEGRAYFTMPIVSGGDLRDAFAKARSGQDGWSLARAVGVLERVCEAMAFAHANGVVHRDLKPSNVMVGRFGEIQVMDWGVARVRGEADARDLRPRPRRTGEEDSSDSPVRTMDGAIIGTPFFMSPEQALGRTALVDERSDVYAVGAMLYELLAGRRPYEEPGKDASPYAVLGRLLEREPAPLVALAPDAPPELIAISEKAMARDPSARYATMEATATELRAFIEGRIVRAYRTGPIAELSTWVRRNRALALAILAVFTVLAGGLATTLWWRSEAALKAQLAQQRLGDILSLSASKDLDDLVTSAAELWPPHPELIQRYSEWLAAARILLEGQPAGPERGLDRRRSLAEHRARLEALQARSVPETDAARLVRARRHPRWGELLAKRADRDARPEAEPSLEAQLLALEIETGARTFQELQDAWWHRQLSELVAGIERLHDPVLGLASDALAEPFGWGIQRRLAYAREVDERTLTGPSARERWSRVVAAIASSPLYGGLRLLPQMGLLPIGVDPDSGLFEFAHLQSGEVPERGMDGRLQTTADTGLVLVLVPGGRFWMGAQAEDPAGPNYDPATEKGQGPPHVVELVPYFLSKYEMTQGQWMRARGSNPSGYSHASYPQWIRSLAHPVEQVSWRECVETLARLGLSLPSEAQWERAARGGTTTPWWTGADRESLRGKVNLADRSVRNVGANWPSAADWPDLDDGSYLHAEVGTYPANPFGLHEIAGNVWEWCLDAYGEYSESAAPASDDGTNRARRGGSFGDTANYVRSAYRGLHHVDMRVNAHGVRPAMDVMTDPPGGGESR